MSTRAATPAPSPPDDPPVALPEGLGYVGLDVSQDEVVACLLLPDGREAARHWTEANTQPS